MGLLTKDQLHDRLFEADINKRLVVSPIFTKEQIGFGTIDVRLGTDFIIPKRSQAYLFDPMNTEMMDDLIIKSDKESVGLGEQFYLHPHKVILGGTLEYFKMPNDLSGRLRCRSSYDRLGLHLTSLANPGYKGSLTLTLTNVGNTPIVLYPGIRLAQISIYTFEGTDHQNNGYDGKYNHEVGPIFSRAHQDVDLKTLKKIKNSNN